jgi:ATP-dependent Lon protease
VAIEGIVDEEPYRRIRIKALTSEPGADPGENARLRQELSRLIKLKLRLSPGGSEGMTDLLKSIEDPEIFTDIAAFNLCDDIPVKQKLLETLDVNRRLLLLLKVIRSEIDASILHLKLQGGLPDDKIPFN